MAEMGEPAAEVVRSQDLRRGHAEDIDAAGGSRDQLYRAGGWKEKSRAVLFYLDTSRLEAEGCMAAPVSGSDSDSD